jgi:hypothetical protein
MRVVCSINSAKTIELGAQNLFFELAAAIGIAHSNNFSILFASTSSYKDPGSILNFRVPSNFLSSGSGSRIFEFLNFQFFFSILRFCSGHSGRGRFSWICYAIPDDIPCFSYIYIHIKGYVRDSVYSSYISDVTYTSVKDKECSPYL